MMKPTISAKLTALIKKEGYTLTDESKAGIAQLAQLLESQESSDITPVLRWLEDKRKSLTMSVEEVGIKDLGDWQVDDVTGNISHKTKRFFSIVGVRVSGAKNREVSAWSQPIMKQNECGILGILCQRQNGVMRYLMYAKSEPGSVVNPQLSPTLQATLSNLERIHGGNKPRFSEYFEPGNKSRVIVSVEHVEDPSRFYLKTNRCMIVEVPENENVAITDDFIWLTLGQIKKLLKVDKVINSLARAVLGSL